MLDAPHDPRESAARKRGASGTVTTVGMHHGTATVELPVGDGTGFASEILLRPASTSNCGYSRAEPIRKGAGRGQVLRTPPERFTQDDLHYFQDLLYYERLEQRLPEAVAFLTAWDTG